MSSLKIYSDKHSHQIVFWLVIFFLLFLRIPFMAGMRLFYGFNVNSGNDWVNVVWQLGTYLFTAFLIWWERDNLIDYHIDFLTVVIIILSMPIQSMLLASWSWGNYYGDVLAFPKLGSLLALVIAIGIIIMLWSSRTKLPRFSLISLGWFIAGIFIGAIWVILNGSLQINKYQLSNYQSWMAMLNLISVRFLYHLGASAVMEEPLFRGLLWGGLRKAGWKDFWIWPFQAILFDLSHIYYWKLIPDSILTVFLSGLFFGLLAWRSKSISMSIAAHSITNALG
jgi:membrane protease YdiL (CAAX protease family)